MGTSSCLKILRNAFLPSLVLEHLTELSRSLIALLVAVLLSGCTAGFLYTDITRPLTTNMHSTPRSIDRGKARTSELREPITGINIKAEWASRSIGDAMSNGALENGEFADIRTVSVLGGLWKRQTVVVYGEARSERAKVQND